ncbi:MAG: DUF4928 family protein [Thermoguttaceae bacterium]
MDAQHETQAIQVLDDWYDGLELYQDKLPAKGSIAAALHVLGRLQPDYNLDISSHVAGGESQIAGLSAAALKKSLAEYGETRVLSAVGGRSNRGARGDVAALLAAMKSLNLAAQSESNRVKALKAMQRHIVEKYVPLYFSVKRVKATFNINDTTWKFIHSILDNARQSGKGGPVAEYLVGAKLSLRFPKKDVRNKRFSESDVQAGYYGDFQIGNTVFHVTVAPMPELFEKCKCNLEQGLRVYLLVPDAIVIGVRQNTALQVGGRIAVESIESFVATNVDELCEFDGDQLKSGFCKLLEAYNARVDAIELDKSMLIEIPANLV